MSDSVRHTSGQIILEGAPRDLANPQYAGAPFTAFGSVCPDTDLANLNLNWRERDLPERERTKHVHRLHPYLGKFIPQLVEIFLRKFRPKLVVDPFMGSGTTLVEAAALGIDAFGCDVAPFNCLLAKAKTDVYELPRIRTEAANILNASRVRDSARSFSLFEEPVPWNTPNLLPHESSQAYLKRWFHPRALNELLAYLERIPGCTYQDFFKVVLSRAARSARLVPHHELDFPKKPQTEPYQCRKHHRICQPTQEARKFLVRYTHDALRRVAEFAAIRRPAQIRILCADAREVAWPPADLVITSPPYIGLIDYHEQHRYSYELLSLLKAPLASVEYVGNGLMSNQPREIGRPTAGTSTRAREAYIDAIAQVFAAIAAKMCHGGHIVCVVGDRLRLYDKLAKRLGFHQVEVLQRHVNRRTGRRNTDFFEEVYIWRVS